MTRSIFTLTLVLVLLFACEEGVFTPETDFNPPANEVTYVELTNAQFQKMLCTNAYFIGELNIEELHYANQTGFCFQAGSMGSATNPARIYVSRIRKCAVPEFNPYFKLYSPSLIPAEIDTYYQPGIKQFAKRRSPIEANGLSVDIGFLVEETIGSEGFFRLVEGSTIYGSQDDGSIEFVKKERYRISDKLTDAFVDLITIAFECRFYNEQGESMGILVNGRALVRSPYYSIY